MDADRRIVGGPRVGGTRVVVADDEPHVVDYVRAVLELEGFEVVGVARDADGAVRLVQDLQPDVVVLDLRMPGDALGATQLITPLSPDTHIVVFSAECAGTELLELLRAGVEGYVLKGTPPEQLVGAIRGVLAGGTFLAPEIGRVAVGALTSRLHAEQLSELREDRRRSNITDALAGGRYRIVVQPIVSLADGNVHAVEALSRFTAVPVRSPDQWFREAEEVGLRVPLELATANAALLDLARMRPHLRMAINISPATALSGRLGEILTTAPIERVIIELTEDQPVADYPALADALAPWRGKGASLAIDDAGGGYASFSHILNLAPDYIKLDGNLTRDIDTDHKRQALARALTGFAREMDVRVIAEAVETIEQLHVLRDLGADFAQGYHVGHPLSLDDQPELRAVPGSPVAGRAGETHESLDFRQAGVQS